MRFRRTQILDGLGLQKPVVVESLLRRGPKRDRVTPPVPSTQIEIELELSEFGAEWASAVQRARDRSAEPAALDGATLASLRVAKIVVTFDDDAGAAFQDGTVHLTGTLAEPFPFPFVPGRVAPARPGDIDFFDALEAATRDAGPVHADEIEELDGYWVFPVHSIGNTGAFVDRRTGRVVGMGSPLPSTLWIWGYEHGLLEGGDLVIEQVRDLSRALAALQRFARVRRPDFDSLPLVVERGASWRAILPLHEAGDAITWRVQRPG